MLDNTYRATYRKQPEQVVIDFKTLKNGTYLIEGDFSQDWWNNLCIDLGLKPKGQGSVSITMTVSQPVLHIKGTIQTEFERECVRDLEMFMDTQTTNVEEYLTYKEDMAGEDILLHEDAQLDMGDFLRQQIVLGFDLHPVKDRSHRGGVVLSDGYEHTPQSEADNPFAVLKELKKS